MLARERALIPDFNLNGVLPPFVGNTPGAQMALSSPYQCTPLELVERFSTSDHRKTLLRGFFKFREALRANGLEAGFQWVNGSFTENVEALPEDATNFEHYARSFNMQTALKTAIDMYRFVRADTKVKNLSFWRSLKSLDEVFAQHSKILETELQLLASDGHHTKVFDINREKVMAAALPVHAAAEEALAAAPE